MRSPAVRYHRRVTANPISEFLDRQGVLILDGGLATQLESRGHELDDDLWSARLLLDDPEPITRLHSDYLVAGADCITSASYQATIEGFGRIGVGEAEAENLLRRSVRLAIRARDDFWSDASNRQNDRLRPLVAASVGPYGAYLADGSEYTGAYDLDEDGLMAFHRRRFQVLAVSGADILACETVPSRPEARALARLLGETPGATAWFSFTCRDDRRLSDGSDLAETVIEIEEIAGDSQRIVALGVNCIAPRHAQGLIDRLRHATSKPIVVYPNSGEAWDAVAKRWIEEAPSFDLVAAGEGWLAAGARLIGGCCRTGPGDVARLRRRLLGTVAA